MAGQKKKLRYSEETPWSPEYYIGWIGIGIGNCGQKTSNKYVSLYFSFLKWIYSSKLILKFCDSNLLCFNLSYCDFLLFDLIYPKYFADHSLFE